MKINRIEITGYGPLPQVNWSDLGNFNLIYGQNEAGKTLLIEAIWHLLWGRRSRKFSEFDRLGENPHGFLRLHLGGKEWKIPEQGTVEKLLGIDPDVFRNAFVVRNSDLNIAGEEEEFYKKVTERLTGMRSAEVEAIEKRLREMAFLTDTGIFKDDQGSGKLKTRLSQAENLLQRIEKLREKAEGEGWEDLEKQLVSKQNKGKD